jgi:hypothetical protein
MKAITVEPKKPCSARREDVVTPDSGTWTCEMAAPIIKGAVGSVVRGVMLQDIGRDICSHKKMIRRYKNV